MVVTLCLSTALLVPGSRRSPHSDADRRSPRSDIRLLGEVDLSGEVDASGMPLSGGASRRRAYFDLDGNGELSADEVELAADRLATMVAKATTTDRDIIIQFELYQESLWAKWRGTVWECVWPRLVLFGLSTAVTCVLIHASAPEGVEWDLLTVPLAADVPIVERLNAVDKTWGYLSGVTTFTLTFFLNQCYDAWRQAFDNSRKMQGRLMDICLAVTSHAQRDESTARYTREAQELIDDVTRLARATHALHWMSQDVALRLLHCDAGLDALARRGLLTPDEVRRIQQSDGPINPRWQMPLAWLMTRVATARERGLVSGGDALHLFLLEAVGKLRGNMGSMQDANTDRMPLAYVHLVEVLVDALLWLSPLALYPETGDLSVLLVLLLVFFYSGVLELSKRPPGGTSRPAPPQHTARHRRTEARSARWQGRPTPGMHAAHARRPSSTRLATGRRRHSPQLRSFLDPFGNAGALAQNIDTEVLVTEMNRDLPRWAATNADVPCLSSRLGGAQ